MVIIRSRIHPTAHDDHFHLIHYRNDYNDYGKLCQEKRATKTDALFLFKERPP
jgi:hypothetical protein